MKEFKEVPKDENGALVIRGIKQLLPIYPLKTIKGNNILIVDGRELHAKLGSKRDFSNWIKDKLETVGARNKIDYRRIDAEPLTKLGERAQSGFPGNPKSKRTGRMGPELPFLQVEERVQRGFPGNPKSKIEYKLTVAIAKEIAMIENTKIGKTIRQYFIAMEEAFSKELADPDLGLKNAYARKVYQLRQMGLEEEEIKHRMRGIPLRNDLTSTYQKHGVVGNGYSLGTNSLYFGLFRADAATLREEMELEPKEATRDGMTTLALDCVMFSETIAKEKIERSGSTGNTECAVRSREAGSAVNKLLQEQGIVEIRVGRKSKYRRQITDGSENTPGF